MNKRATKAWARIVYRFKLLGSNTKLDKALEALGGQYLTVGLTLSPHKTSGRSVCPQATPGCISSCVLYFAGFSVMPNVRKARQRKTRLLFDNPAVFHEMLRHDLDLIAAFQHQYGVTVLVRLNTASDLDWIRVIEEYPSLQFYDYTKVVGRMKRYIPDNYSLTYSWSERSNHRETATLLRKGHNVAMVFNVAYNPQHDVYGDLPTHHRIDGEYFPVVDGDTHDARIPALDGQGVIVGLRLKGGTESRKRAVSTGFAIQPQFATA